MWFKALRQLLIHSILTFVLSSSSSWAAQKTPLRQSELTFETAAPSQPLTLRDAARDDRWLGVGVREVRWATDGEAVYFRWHTHPSADDDPEADSWFRVDRAGTEVQEVDPAESAKIPTGDVSWSLDGRRAAWTREGDLYIYDGGRSGRERVHAAVATERASRRASISSDGETVQFMLDEDLYRYEINEGLVRQMTLKVVREPEKKTESGRWLESQQLDLFEHHRRAKARRESSEERKRLSSPDAPQPIPVSEGTLLEEIRLSPDGLFVVFRARKKNEKRHATRYVDFVSESGYAEVHEARAKVGEPRDEINLGMVRMDPTVDPDDVEVVWVSLPEAGERPTLVHGPYWNLEGNRALVQVLSADHKDLWIAELDLDSGRTTVLAHDHDDAWLGGPPILPNNFNPALLEWLPDDRFVFASERSGWSHLYLVEKEGSVRALTSGEWEVRDAALSRDRSFWLITASREHPSDDHLYLLPAAGGELIRFTEAPGRHRGWLSPDGKRAAVVHSDSVRLPDLFLRDVEPGAESRRVTVSGTDAFYRHPLVRPEIVSFDHSDGRSLWAALYKPEHPSPERAAVLHIHGGGYRQFSHRGWSVYGYAMHLGALQYLVQEGYTVLDFDYRGSAGFGRDYRTDIYRSMGMKDIDGAVTAVQYLQEHHGIDSSRVGIYGISYGGFATLMALFHYPGVFAAGVANAAVTDWAHYNHNWTSRILNLPYQDEDAYRLSSPIYHAQGLEDPLLIVHGLIDDNVHFQDAARLVQKLIELEKDFEVMVYPVERHTIQTEASRYDYMKRLTRFFERNLLRRFADE